MKPRRSNPQNSLIDNLERPWVYTYRWKPAKGQWEQYDRKTGEKSLRDPGFPFVPLDHGHMVTGFSERLRKGIWSGTVRDPNSALCPKAGDEILAIGSWREIRDKVKAEGGKWTLDLYALAEVEGEKQTVRFNLSGCGLGNINDLSRERDIYAGDVALRVTRFEEFTYEGKVFLEPVFGTVSLTDGTRAAAADAKRKLHAHFDIRNPRMAPERSVIPSNADSGNPKREEVSHG